MTLSESIVYDILRRGDKEEIRRDLGFITQVLKDNELSEELYRYYDAVIDLIKEVEERIEC